MPLSRERWLPSRGWQSSSSCHFLPLPFLLERSPALFTHNVVDHVHCALELCVAGVKVWRHTDARVRPVVHDHVIREQRLRDAVGMWNVERNRASAPRRVARGSHLVTARIGKLDETRCLPHTLFTNCLDARTPQNA